MTPPEEETSKEEEKRENEYTEMPLICPDCGVNLVFDPSRGEIYCPKCGRVIESPEAEINLGKEWREFDSSDREKRRAGAPFSFLQVKQAGTVLEKKDITKLPSMIKPIATTWLKTKKYTKLNQERNIEYAMSEIERLANALNLPSYVKEEAARIYKKAAQKNLIRGRSIDVVVAASIYAACRIFQIPRTLDEIAKATEDRTKKEIGKTYRFLMRELGIKTPPTNPIDFLERIVNRLKLSAATYEKAKEILLEAQRREITSGKGPTGIAAAAVYIASLLTGEKRTQREVAQAAGVTEVTIRNRYKELVKKLGIKIPTEKGKEESK